MDEGNSSAEPLHGQDPYGTPPYGPPGPWAPAPPVQRPEAPSAAPDGDLATPERPASPAPAPAPAGAGEPAPPPAGRAGGATAGAAQHGTPADGTRMPPTAPAPPPTAATAPGSTTTASPGIRPEAVTGPPAAGGPMGAAPAPAAAAAPGGAPGAGGHPGGSGTPAGGTPVPPAAGGYPGAHPGGFTAAAMPELPGEPLRRYDPWAVPPAGYGGYPAPGPAPAGPARPRPGLLVAGALLVALVSGLTGGAVGVYLERNGELSQEVTLPQVSAADRTAAPGTTAGIAEAVLPGVVTLHVQGRDAAGTGTGFVLDHSGHILTNAHVVDPAGGSGQIQVTFGSGDSVEAELVGADSGYDLAVVKVDNVSGLHPLPLGDSEAVAVGDPVVAIGSPFDLEGTVTSGIISAKDRPITAGGSADGSDISYVNALQTDAAINPGNSGGPLVDLDGLVIGINTAIRTPDLIGGPDGEGRGGSIGLGFAIPVNQAKRVAEELINNGFAVHPVIGVRLDGAWEGEGVRVAGNSGGPAVDPGGPADRAGVQEGDVIIAVDGDRVLTAHELIVKIRSHQPGDELVLTVERGGGELDISVILGQATSS
ncbi:S1C family serine protease [Streptomyces aidingensis]|uniref:Putative serine protease PepD n=1 Tax=Streptomyces aidingensis TaxID=910347 RepID=A0A1I1F146_9ACTN|nr:trypsin-like peptidase domain-containing protein [Streptomyces aidingensis]SFB90883.1 putative serine protease PepD [Streptomyces aidingensis]